MTDAPTAAEVDAAILMLNPAQQEAMADFMPGMHPRRIQEVHHQLSTAGLIELGWRSTGKANLAKAGDWVFTPLGRAVQAKLRASPS